MKSKKPTNRLNVQIKAVKLRSMSGQKSSYGLSMSNDKFIGLPSSGLKRKWVQVVVEPNHQKAVAPVGDIGPWNGGGFKNEFDDPYWIKNHRPQSESGKDIRKRKTNKAGISISSSLWELMGLGKKRTVQVHWQFVPAPRNKKIIIVDSNGKRFFTRN